MIALITVCFILVPSPIYASNNIPGSASWTAGIAVALIGTLFLFRVAIDEWNELKPRFMKMKER